jgi:hypothetical protein
MGLSRLLDFYPLSAGVRSTGGNTSSNGREMKRHWQKYSAKDSNTVLPKGGYVRLLASSGEKEFDIIYARLGFVRESSCWWLLRSDLSSS